MESTLPTNIYDTRFCYLLYLFPVRVRVRTWPISLLGPFLDLRAPQMSDFPLLAFFPQRYLTST